VSCIEALEKPRPKTPSGLPIILVAAAALINTNEEILLDAGESPEFALARELAEELGIETRECCFAPLGFASHAYDDFHLLMPLYACRMWKGIPEPKEGQELAWVKPNDLAKYDMPPADIPLIYQIQDRL